MRARSSGEERLPWTDIGRKSKMRRKPKGIKERKIWYDTSKNIKGNVRGVWKESAPWQTGGWGTWRTGQGSVGTAFVHAACVS
jgi:hypothetical protein